MKDYSALALLALSPIAASQAPVVEEAGISTGFGRFDGTTQCPSGATCTYDFEVEARGTGISSVTVQTPNAPGPQALLFTGEEWQYYREGFASLDAIANDPTLGFGQFVLTFVGPGGTETATVSYDPGCAGGCTDPHDGYGAPTFPVHGQTGVPLNPTITWQCTPGTTCGNFAWYAEVYPLAGPGLGYETDILNPAATSWTPGCLTAGTQYELWLTAGTALQWPPLMVPTQPSGNTFVYFEGFETTNLIRFTTQAGLGTSYCAGMPNSTGEPGRLCASGSRVIAQDDFHLLASDLPPGQFGYFLAGRTQGMFMPPGSQGVICLSGNIGRYNQVANIVQGPVGGIQVDLGSIPVNPPAAVQPGETWNFQCWYRDVNPALTSNFTDAVSVDFL